MAKDQFFLPVVHRGIELKFRKLLRIVDCPAAESTGDRDDVLLRVASIDTQRMQFEQLAAVVLIQARPAHSRRKWNVVARNLRLPIVEIEQHCGMPGCGKQHVLKVSKDIWTYGITLKTGEQHAIRPLPVEHIEVIHPEVHQHFLELPIRIDRSIQLVLDQLRVHRFLWLSRSHGFAPKLRHVS